MKEAFHEHSQDRREVEAELSVYGCKYIVGLSIK